jgi:hypothetical protein
MKLKEVQLVTLNGENYLLSDDTTSDLFVFSINNELILADFEELLGSEIQWTKPVLIKPDGIGWVNEGLDNGLFRLTLLSNHHLEDIRNNNGVCKIEVNEYDNDVPIFYQSKVILHI